MPNKSQQDTLRVGQQGRLVIPARIRKASGIQTGQKLLIHAEQGRLTIEKPEAALSRLQVKLNSIPAGVNLVEELLTDRRQESRREKSA